jgi:hypothetical protein
MLIPVLMVGLMMLAFGALLLTFSIGERLSRTASVWGWVLSLIGMVICAVFKFGIGMALFLVANCAYLALYMMRGAWKLRAWLTIAGMLVFMVVGGHIAFITITEPVAYEYQGEYRICTNQPVWWTTKHPSRATEEDCTATNRVAVAERVVYPPLLVTLVVCLLVMIGTMIFAALSIAARQVARTMPDAVGENELAPVPRAGPKRKKPPVETSEQDGWAIMKLGLSETFKRK